MNCYDFELNISAYIEGELKQMAREDFIQHKEICSYCTEKLVDISDMMQNMPNLKQVETSSQFVYNLHEKIREIDNRGPTIWQRLIRSRPLGFEPVPAIGFVLAIVMIIGASYILLNQDILPKVDLEKLSTQSQQDAPRQFQPSIITPEQTLPSMADSDTSVKSTSKSTDPPIKLVGGRK